MAINRRTVLQLALLASSPSLKAQVRPGVYLSAGRNNRGFTLSGLTADGETAWSQALPDRGHGCANHPYAPIAIHCARRPGRFFIALNKVTGQIVQAFNTPAYSHAYGHATFSNDGKTLYTTENHIDSHEGLIGVWDTENFNRIGEFPLGAIGPHELKLIPQLNLLAVAIGGIKTHPDSGRDKLNLDTMESSLQYHALPSGNLIQAVSLPLSQQRFSMRHLDVNEQNQVIIASQEQGSSPNPSPLIARHSLGEETFLQATAPEQLWRKMRGYIGSIRYDRSGQFIAASSPRANMISFWHTHDLSLIGSIKENDACGISSSAVSKQFFISSGTGATLTVSIKNNNTLETTRHQSSNPQQWDNHIS